MSIRQVEALYERLCAEIRTIISSGRELLLEDGWYKQLPPLEVAAVVAEAGKEASDA